ncbi:MAG: RNA polymerase sporulation sigma factor SigE, partial [Clostridia bacterium]|nr:RNA polymerase sporulation sigma factor SigE [Clostridia bacterium]
MKTVWKRYLMFLFPCLKSFLKTERALEEQGVYYINGPDELPPPLSAEEERDCIEKMESGNGEESRNLLVEHNLRLVVY